MKKVSIILTTYNGKTRGYLEEAINSVLGQTFRDYELLIIDDGSTDKTKDICLKYIENERVRYIYQKNKGLAGARNTGIKQSKGKFICFLDDDDIWKKDKLKKQLDFFKKNDKAHMVFTNLELIDEKGNKIGYQKHFAYGDIYNKLFKENIVDAPSSVMIRRNVFDEIGLFKEWMKSSEDYELWFRIAKDFNIYSLNEPLVKYRVHENKMVANHPVMEYYTTAALYYALEQNQNADKALCYSNLNTQFFDKHLFLKNYKEARKYFWISFAYNTPNVKTFFKYLISHFPIAFRLIIKLKRLLHTHSKLNFL